MPTHGNRPAGENFWRPASEAEATGNAAAFIEWGRATGGVPAEYRAPAGLRQWIQRDPAGCGAAIASFAGLRRSLGWRGNLLRHRGDRIALRVWSACGAYRSWSRDQLRTAADLPSPLAAALAGGTWDDLTALAASHLLVADTRPDDDVQWLGAPEARWPLGAWIVGACLSLGGPPQPGARVFAAAPQD